MGNLVGRKKLVEPGLTVTEGAVFTLMALLVAFTFASAAQRLDQRRILIVEEANAVNTAYLRLSILQPSDQATLKADFLSYINARLAIYNAFSNTTKPLNEIERSNIIQEKLWQDAVNACKNSPMAVAPMLVLSPINLMFDLGNSRLAYTLLHIPFLVFALLAIVALLSGFLTGYGISKKGSWYSLHVIAYALIISITIYIILDLEAPRLGLIKETSFDSLLIDVKNNISVSSSIH